MVYFGDGEKPLASFYYNLSLDLLWKSEEIYNLIYSYLFRKRMYDGHLQQKIFFMKNHQNKQKVPEGMVSGFFLSLNILSFRI